MYHQPFRRCLHGVGGVKRHLSQGHTHMGRSARIRTPGFRCAITAQFNESFARTVCPSFCTLVNYTALLTRLLSCSLWVFRSYMQSPRPRDYSGRLLPKKPTHWQAHKGGIYASNAVRQTPTQCQNRLHNAVYFTQMPPSPFACRPSPGPWPGSPFSSPSARQVFGCAWLSSS